LITDDAVAENVIRQRRADGLDAYDEMWEGVYHVVPAGSRRHGEAQAGVLSVLREWTWPPRPGMAHGSVVVTGPVNIGTPDSYRVPDAAILTAGLDDDAVFVPTALLVVEVLSPGDDTFKKFDFYLSCGIDEIVVVDPENRTVELHATGRYLGYAEVDRSEVLGVDDAAEQILRAMGW
jgi:Uma2 family endonuclease